MVEISTSISKFLRRKKHYFHNMFDLQHNTYFFKQNITWSILINKNKNLDEYIICEKDIFKKVIGTY